VILIIRALALVLGLLALGGAQGQTYKAEYRLSTVLNSSFPWGMAGERWAELVRDKTQGRINIKLYPGAALVNGDQTREFTAIRQGVIDLAIGSTINWSPQVKELNLFSLPFLMPDHRAIDALTQGEVGQDLFRVLEQRGVVPLAWGENGFRELSNARRPIAAPADMRGLKVRVVGSLLFHEVFTALGATPVQMGWSDLRPALEQGAVDGQENPLAVFMPAKLSAAGQRQITLWHYVADPLVFAVNPLVWNSWTPGDREAVRQAAMQAARENIARVRSDGVLLQQIEASGVRVVRLSVEQRAAFARATRPVYDKWAENIGPELVRKAEAAIARR